MIPQIQDTQSNQTPRDGSGMGTSRGWDEGEMGELILNGYRVKIG